MKYSLPSSKCPLDNFQVLFVYFLPRYRGLFGVFFFCLCFCGPGCQSFQAKSLTCPQSEFISYPLERNVHDALPSPPLNGEDWFEHGKLFLTTALQRPAGLTCP